jgi:hypothetical protein
VDLCIQPQPFVLESLPVGDRGGQICLPLYYPQVGGSLQLNHHTVLSDI